MTKLTKPVRREVVSAKHGALIVTLAPAGILFREKGRRISFLMPFGVVYEQAVWLHVQQQKAEKKARRGRAS